MSDDTRKPDHESDPAHNDEIGHDWSDEGGATLLGPATHPTVVQAVTDADDSGAELE